MNNIISLACDLLVLKLRLLVNAIQIFWYS